MNNDIPYDYNHIKPQPVAGSKGLHDDSLPAIEVQSQTKDSEKKDSRDYFNVMGHAQVNMDSLAPSSLRKSVEEFLKDPETAQMQMDFCDELMQEGYTLEDAVEKSDTVFKTLKNQAIYN